MLIECRALEKGILSDTHLRLLEHISTTRYSSKFGVLYERTLIQRIISTPRTCFNYSKSIKASMTREKETYRKHIFGCFTREKPIIITVLPAKSKFFKIQLFKYSVLNLIILLELFV